MNQYYFLVASLPFLSRDSDRASPPEEFLASAREHLTPRDYTAVCSARIDAPVELEPGPPVVTKWQRFERGLRNELVKVRAARLGADPAEHIRTDEAGSDDTDQTGLTDTAREAFGEESPLSGEDVLGRARWEFLTELEVGHFFDVDRLVVYYLKLQLLARKRLFNRDDGERAFKAATDRIMNDYYQEQGDL
ncbi:MAG: DUF2764 domain-containing protein [Spirochaetales bacterium]|nr:DUF2764 domain-containing protein [Spirochaetales bacterium]